ncbi:MAG: hypothetical protein NT178_09375 [Proteobacteria bacterium]|nr:hypothetical protein [Pseudomonadota bacterium]
MASQKIPLYEIHEVAYLSLNNIPVEFEKRGTRVVFLVPSTPETYRFLGEYNENPRVNLLDFVGCLRKIRGQMLTLRDGGDVNDNGVRNGNYNR